VICNIGGCFKENIYPACGMTSLFAWLNTNASAIQALTAIFLGIPTLCLLYRATNAAKHQAIAADEQAAAARLQSQIATEELLETTRPVIVLSRVDNSCNWDDAKQSFIIKNDGQGAAIHIIFEFLIQRSNGEIESFGSFRDWDLQTLPPRQSMIVPAGKTNFNTIRVYYQSVRGADYTSSFVLTPEAAHMSYGKPSGPPSDSEYRFIEND